MGKGFNLKGQTRTHDQWFGNPKGKSQGKKKSNFISLKVAKS